MFARCPACQTVFRVQPEQLLAHHGEVRCGRCYASFNARDHVLHVASAAAASAGQVPQPLATAPSAPEAVPHRGDRFFILDDPPSPAPITRHIDFPSDDAGAGTRPAAAACSDTEIPRSGTPFDADFDAQLDAQLDNFSDSLDFEIPETFVASRPVSAPQPVHSAPPWPRPAGYGSFTEFPDRPPAKLEAVDEGAPSQAEAAAPFPPELFEPLNPREPERSPENHLPFALPSGGTEDEPLPPIRRARAFGNPSKLPDLPAAPESAAPLDHPEDEPQAAEYVPPPPVQAPGKANDRQAPGATYAPPAPSGTRWLPALGIALLLGTLALQSVFVFRDGITRKWPQLRTAYLSACAYLKCTLPLSRVAGAISIEAAELQSEPNHPARFVLNATLRNRAPHPQAYPHLELTLTDVQDRPLVRRVLGPAQWLPASLLEQREGGAERQFDAGRDVVVELPFEAPGVEATGYRIYAFYP